MFKFKHFLLLGILGVVLLAGLMVTSNIQGSTAAHASGCNDPARGSLGSGTLLSPSWSNNCQISEGNISDYVYAFQTILNDDSSLCGSLSVDGNFGSHTLAAVECLQRHFNLNPDGIVGTNTWNVLAQALGFKENRDGFDFFIVKAGLEDFRMSTSTQVWQVHIASDNEWCSMDLNSPC